MKVIIDRFEKDFAIVEIEEGLFANLPKVLIPYATEGDVIEIKVNHQKTEERKKTITKLINQAFESDNEQ
ncbi:MAG: DUF3006 domain-containing protein [Bacilli bacterium]|nr:DUF3006 domain-containing protein [Bacilli bacterium]